MCCVHLIDTGTVPPPTEDVVFRGIVMTLLDGTARVADRLVVYRPVADVVDAPPAAAAAAGGWGAADEAEDANVFVASIKSSHGFFERDK